MPQEMRSQRDQIRFTMTVCTWFPHIYQCGAHLYISASENRENCHSILTVGRQCKCGLCLSSDGQFRDSRPCGWLPLSVHVTLSPHPELESLQYSHFSILAFLSVNTYVHGSGRQHYSGENSVNRLGSPRQVYKASLLSCSLANLFGWASVKCNTLLGGDFNLR